MGGGNKKRYNKAKSRKPPHPSSSSSSVRALFVEGGVLADWSPSFNSPPSRGKKNSSGGDGNGLSASRSSSNGKERKKWSAGPGPGHGSGYKSGSNKRIGNVIGYEYPSFDPQEGLLSNGDEQQESKLDNSCPIVLVDSKETPIVAYVDEGPIKDIQGAEYTYDYSSGFTLDETSHRGLGFYNEAEGNLGGIGMSSKLERKEGSYVEPSSSEEEMNDDDDTDTGSGNGGDDFLAETLSPEENPGFLSIGGLKIYTQDIEDDESDEEELLDEESSESSKSEDSSETSDSEEISDSDSDIDDEVAADYFEGIAGSKNIVDVDQLVGRNRSLSSDNGLPIDTFDETLEKFGGIALQEASREYGMTKRHSGRKCRAKDRKFSYAKCAWSSALDDIMVVKDPRTTSGKKKHVPKFPKSWPFEAQKSRKFGNTSGEKKKRHKEMIALKRRERMIRRGVDLQEINVKLQQMVLDGVEILSFQPMHSQDCSQVQRLAAIYRLRSASQGSGKKRFVTVTRTQHTCMPSSRDTVRLEKLIGANDRDSDFTVYDIYSTKEGRNTAKKDSKVVKSELSKKKRSGKPGSYATQPVSFVSSGIMGSDVAELSAIETNEMSDTCRENKQVSGSITRGAFELHTTGFGSKMLAKMGYVEGGGLGKDGQGMAEPIEVFQRPKSLGLGADVPETSTQLEKRERQPILLGLSFEFRGTSSKLVNKESQQFASFERHTKGFGSKMMAKMGFVEGMGLGKDSQGMVKPLVAVRRPKSRGLGANG